MYGAVPQKVLGVGFVVVGVVALAVSVVALLRSAALWPDVVVLVTIGVGFGLWGAWFLSSRLATAGLVGALLLAAMLMVVAIAILTVPEQVVVTAGRGPRTAAEARAVGVLLLACSGVLAGVAIWGWRRDRTSAVHDSEP